MLKYNIENLKTLNESINDLPQRTHFGLPVLNLIGLTFGSPLVGIGIALSLPLSMKNIQMISAFGGLGIAACTLIYEFIGVPIQKYMFREYSNYSIICKDGNSIMSYKLGINELIGNDELPFFTSIELDSNEYLIIYKIIDMEELGVIDSI